MTDNQFNAFVTGINELIEQVSGGNKKQFARDLGVNYDTVRCWCAGEYLPGGETLLLLHEKYNVSIDYLLTGKDPGAAFMNEWPPLVRDACTQVKEILTQGKIAAAVALHTNIKALAQTVQKNKERENPEYDLDMLKAVVRELRRQEEEKKVKK